jgi:adenylate cyclase
MARSGRNVPLVVAIVAAAGALLVLAMHLWVAALPGLGALEDLTIDGRFKLRGPRAPASDRIVIVGIDDDTRAKYPELMQTRRAYADLVRALTRYDVKVMAFDLFFAAPEVVLPSKLAGEVRATDAELKATPPTDETAQRLATLLGHVADELRGDDQLAAAIAESRRVFLGAFFREGNGAAAPAPAKLAVARHGETVDAGAGGARRPIHAIGVDFTLDAIAKGAIGAGAVNAFRDGDGVVRRMPLAIEFGGNLYMPLGLAVALYDLGQPRATTYVAGARTLQAGDRTLPVGAAASLSLDVLGRDRLPHVSAAAVLAGSAPRAALAGKLAFVGHTFSTTDKIATPLDTTADGIELHATLAENVLAGRVLRLAGAGTTLFAAAMLCAIVIVTQLRPIRRRTWVPPVVALGAIGAYIAIAQLAFGSGTILAVAAPIATTIVVVIAALIGGLATEGREKAHLRAMFSRYVSRTVVDRILADPARARLGGERKELTVLFSDIRGFSAFAEGMGPETLASFLGEYLTPMTQLVLDSGGTLDKYIGDAVMALWAAPVDMPDHAARACEVALKMQEALGGLNARWKAEGKPEIAIGIGINTGAMAVGNMGTAARFDYTVLGDQVNLGSRLEALTKDYGVDILVGEATMRAAGAGFTFREIDVVRVKGRAGAAPVYELVGRAGAATDPAFAEALAAYRKREFATARARFGTLAGDPAARAMAARCAVLETAPPPEDWDGVYEQRSK